MNTSHLVVHPEYEYYRTDWTKIRDAIAGEREIKRKGEVYLRRMKKSDDEDYADYLDRAVFYNMSGQTQAGMVGQIFLRPPVVRSMPKSAAIMGRAPDGSEIIVSPSSDKNTPFLRRFAKDGTSHHGFAKTAASEQIALGRFGALVDASQDNPDGLSYVVGYTAENIVDWTIEDVYGVYTPTRIMLREFERIDAHDTPTADNPWIGREGKNTRGYRNGATRGKDKLEQANLKRDARPSRYTSSYTYRTIYRELCLELQNDGTYIYKQYVYVEDPLSQARDVFIPQIRGKPLNFIPFVFFGAGSNVAECEKPPLLDIVELNLKHYRTYAELEHGRFYTAMPIYYAPGGEADNQGEYHIGPSTVWEVPVDGKPGIVEFKGEGLKTLERALNDKEAQIAAIGGRLMPGMSKSVSESDNQVALREANEQSLLINVIMALEEGMSMLMRYWLMFRDVPLAQSAELRYEVDTSFLTNTSDARTLRVIQQLYEAGILPIDSLYENLVKNGLVPSSMSLEEFTAKMKNPSSFIGQPDVEAMRRGYANRSQELEQARVAREVEMENRKLDLDTRRVELDEEKLEIAEKVGSTSVTASRKLGDPEGAAPSQAEQEQVEVQREATKAAAKLAKAKPATPPRKPAE